MSLFKRPAWAKYETTEPEKGVKDEGNIFSHSGRSYQEIVAEQERKKHIKAERKKAKEERRSSGKRDIKVDLDKDASSKRRRISLDDEDVVLEKPHRSPSPVARVQASNHAVEGLEQRDSSSMKYMDTEDRQPVVKHNRPAEVVELGNSDAEDDAVVTAVLPKVQAVEDGSDEEFAALAQRARIERQRKQQQSKKSHTPDDVTHSGSPGTDLLDTGQGSWSTPLPDPTIQLLITTRLPNINALIVMRRLSQNIADVRRIWCQKQGLSAEQTKEIFFVHRGRRVYDVTTCRSLGLEVDSFGNVTVKGAEGKEDIDKVHLEAVTEEIFQQMKDEKARESQKRDDSLLAGQEQEHGDVKQPEEEPFIRIVLRAKGRDDFKMKVKAATTISKIIAGYSKKMLSSGETAFLLFDGERLNPEDDVQKTEISDMDCLDVRILHSS